MKTSKKLGKHKITLAILGLILVAIVTSKAQTVIKNKNTTKAVVGNQSKLINYQLQVSNQIKSDLNGADGFREKTLGFERNLSENEAIVGSTVMGSFFMNKKDLLEILYPTRTSNPTLKGINIWFTKNAKQIAITKATSSSDTIFEDLDTNYTLLISKSLSDNKTLTSTIQTSTLSLQKIKNVEIPIHGYFLGRIALISHILNPDDSINSKYAGYEIVVREKNKQRFVCIYAVKNIKNKEFVGVAKYEENTNIESNKIILLDKMGGSRPCPPYCRTN